MKKELFVKNALLLTAITLITRSLGIFFRIYISGKIGAEGVGLMGLAMTVYSFSATFAASGITLTVTRLVTDTLAKNNKAGALFAVKRCVAFSVIMSSAVGFCLFIFSNEIGTCFLKDERSVLSLKVLSASLPFMAASSCLRGYFFARRQSIKTALEQLLEQVCEIGVFMTVSLRFLPMGLEYACCGVVLGTTLAEFISFFFSLALYVHDVRKLGEKSKRIPNFGRKALAIGTPVTLSSCLRSGLSMGENVLIPYGLKKYGADGGTALGEYGKITGMAMPVIIFPNVFLYSFAMLMIPEMSEAKISGSRRAISRMAQRVMSLSLMFSICVACMFLFFGDDIAMMLYGDKGVGVFIKTLAPIIPLLYLDQVVDGMLKGLNEQLHYLIYNIIDSVTRVILTFTLLPVMGTKGVIIVCYVSAILNSGLSTLRLIKVANIDMRIFSWIIYPAIAGVVSGAAAEVLLPGGGTGVFLIITKCLVFAAVFLLMIFAGNRIFGFAKSGTARNTKTEIKKTEIRKLQN